MHHSCKSHPASSSRNAYLQKRERLQIRDNGQCPRALIIENLSLQSFEHVPQLYMNLQHQSHVCVYSSGSHGVLLGPKPPHDFEPSLQPLEQSAALNDP
jgi:hypothetical protein